MNPLPRVPRSGHLRPYAAAGSRHASFTLVELLIATFVGLLSLSAIIAIIISYVNSRNRLEASVRLQDNWARLQFLLDREIQESVPVTSASSVSTSCGSGTIRLSLEVPGNSNRIIYYTSAANLRRCGPVIDANGNLGSTVADQLLLNDVSSFTADTSDPQRPSFSLSLSDAGGVTYTNQIGRAHV